MSTLPKVYLHSIKKKTLAYQMVRRDVIKVSGDALHYAKKAIFAMHRGSLKEADTHLKSAEKLLISSAKKFKKTPQALTEGAWGAAIEEFVEATLLRAFLAEAPLKKITIVPVSDAQFVSGLADVPGELYRYALKAGTKHNTREVERALMLALQIVDMLIEFDFTKQMRSKFDQAKAALHKIERVAYEGSLHHT